MYEIRFLKKHKILLASIIAGVLIIFLYAQLGVLGKRYELKKELHADINQEQLVSATLKKNKKNLEKMPELVKSNEIKGFTTSDEIAKELTTIEKKFQAVNVDVISLTMAEEDYFRDEKRSNEVIRRKVVTMDVTADTDKDLEAFIKDIESNKQRVAKIKSVDYKASSGINEVAAATIEFYMYYVQMED